MSMQPPQFQPYPASPQGGALNPNALRPVAGLRTASIVMLCVAAASGVLLPIIGFFSIFAQYANQLQDGTFTQDSAVSLGLQIFGWFLLAGAIALAADIVFWVFLWRMRVNAEAIAGPQSHRLSRGWTFWGWICPIVNFWFPYLIVVDIYRASTPDRSDDGGIVLRWWITPLISAGVFLLLSLARSIPLDLIAYVIAIAASITSFVWFIMIINRITAWQEARLQSVRSPYGQPSGPQYPQNPPQYPPQQGGWA